MAGRGGVLVGRGYVLIRPEFAGDWDRRVGSQTSRSGAQGGRSFGAAFAKSAASSGISGLGKLIKASLAGSGVAAAAVGIQQIGAAALAASAVAVPALSAIGTAGAAVGVGLKGVGKAFKAFDSAAQDAKAAASATRAVESAQRALGRAQQGVSDARVAAARRVADAERSLADAQKDAARSLIDAQRDAARAQQDVVDAQRDAIDVQKELTDARQDAARQLEDLNTRLADSALDQREAVLRLKDAQADLAKAREGSDQDAIARAELALDRARANVTQQSRDYRRLQEDAAAANKAGVEGSDQVVAARERIAEANSRIMEASDRAAEANRKVTETQAEGARRVADAQRDVAEAQVDGAKQIAQANEAVADAARALTEAQSAAASQVSKVDEAMAKLTPSAREFVTTVKDLGPAWGEVRKATQESLFKGVAGSFREMSKQIIPDLKSGLSGAAGAINSMWRNWMDGVRDLSKDGTLKRFFDGNTKILSNFAKWPAEATKGWIQMSVAATPALDKLTTKVADASTRLSERMTKSFESGEMEKRISGAVDRLKVLADPLRDIGKIFSNVFEAIAGPGQQALGVFGVVLDELARITSKPEVKDALTRIFTAFVDITRELFRVLGPVIERGLPLLADGLGWVADKLPVVVDWLGRFASVAIDKIGSGIGAATQGTKDFFGAFQSGDVSAQASAMERIGAATRGFSDKAAGYARGLFDAFRDGEQTSAWFVANPGLTGVFDRLGVAARSVSDLIRQQVFPVFLDLGRAIQSGLTPIVESFSRIWTEHVQHQFERVTTVIERALVPIFQALGEFIRERISPALTELGGKLSGLLDALAPVISVLDSLVTWIFKVGSEVLGWLVPILLQLAGPIFSFLVDVLLFAIDVMTWVVRGITALGQAATWLWREAIVPAATGIAGSFRWLYDNGIKPAVDLAKGAVRGFGELIREVHDKWIKPWFDTIVSTTSSALGKFVAAFGAAKGFLGEVWDGVKKVIATPIQWVIDHVYGGIRAVWNFVASKVGLPELGEGPRIPGYAEGGIYPGYTPGRDIGIAAVSGGEAIMRPEWTRAVGAGYVNAANAAAVSGGSAGVQRFLGEQGIPFAGGFGLGGIVGGVVKSAANIVGGIPGVDDAVKWVKDLARGAAAKAVEAAFKPLRGMVNALPDSPELWQLVAKVPLNWMDRIVDKIKGEDAKVNGGFPVLNALQWAKSQAGKPYQWGGGGNPSWDCSGFMAGIQQTILGRKPGRLYTTFDFNGAQAPAGWKQGLEAPFTVGVINFGLGHMAGTLAGTNVESRGGDGVVVGPAARGSHHPLFDSFYGFEPSLASAGAGAMPTGTLAQWIGQALAATGTPPPGSLDQWMRGLSVLVGRESGGNPLAMNTTDSNARAGNASRGLAQVIPSTFAAFRSPNLPNNIWDPAANIAAAINWIKFKYGDISRVQQANPNLPPKGYSFGGIVPRGGGTHDMGGWLEHGQLGLNMSGSPEAVLTGPDYALMRAAAVANNRGVGDVHVYVGDREITDIVRVELRDYNGALVSAFADGRG